MVNRTYKIPNGLTMVESVPYHWQKEPIYHGHEEPCHYYIALNPMAAYSISCSFREDTGILSINGIQFKVDSLEEAGQIVKKIVDGSGIDIEGTIYEPTLENVAPFEWQPI